MAKTILQRTLKEGARRRGRQKKRWEDNIKEWTGIGFWRFPEGSGRQGRMERYCCGAPTTSKVKGLRDERDHQTGVNHGRNLTLRMKSLSSNFQKTWIH